MCVCVPLCPYGSFRGGKVGESVTGLLADSSGVKGQDSCDI